MGDIFENYYEPTRTDVLLRRTKIAIIGLLAVAGFVMAIQDAVPKYRQIMSEYEARQAKPILPKTDEELVRQFVNESKTRNPKTGAARSVYKLSGAMAVQQHKYDKDGVQPASITNFVLVKLRNNKTYLYGENAVADPKIFRLDQVVICALRGAKVQLEEVVLGHDVQGGIALKGTGQFLPNDREWQEKCVSYIPGEQIAISAEV